MEGPQQASEGTERVELEPAAGTYAPPPPDRRPHMPEPPPVRLVAVEDVHVTAGPGMEPLLDDFYERLLRFEREPHGDRRRPHQPARQIVYKAENVRLVFDIADPHVERPDFRPIGVEIPDLSAAEHEIIERKLEYERFKGLIIGRVTLMLRDPAGNWVAISEARRVQ